MSSTAGLTRIGLRHVFSTKFIVVGFVAILGLAVSVFGTAAVEVNRIVRVTLQLAEESQHSTYYLTKPGEELARLRSQVAFGLSESPSEFARRAPPIARIESRLHVALSSAPATLDQASWWRWATLQPEIARLQQVYRDAAQKIQIGDTQRASASLAREAPAATRLHDALDDLVHMHREAVVVRLRSARDRAAFVLSIELVFAGVFLVGVSGVFGAMLWRLRRQGRQLAEYTSRLEATNADLDEFAGRVAHDLRNALGPIMMAPGLLREAPADQALVLKTADRTERSARTATAIIDALLAFSRAATSVETDETGSVRSVLKVVLEELAPVIARLDVEIDARDIPSLDVRLSPGLLHILLANLCGNAVKYVEGREERRVRISARAEGTMCRLSVEDTGPGIPEDEHEKIFEPFYRVAGGRVPGTGIGLATVRRILETRNGRVEVESQVGRGSRFDVWLPLAPPAVERPARREPAISASAH